MTYNDELKKHGYLKDAPEFVVKDSGKREEYDNGFVRDTEEGKPDYARIMAVPGLDLIPIEMLERLGAHLSKGAVKYGRENWRKATGLTAKLRFARSLFRHARQLILGHRDEDHAAATTFNVWAYELTPVGESVYQDSEGTWHDRIVDSEQQKEFICTNGLHGTTVDPCACYS